MLKSGVGGNFLQGGLCHIVIYPGDSDMLPQIGLALSVIIMAFPHLPTKSLLLTENKTGGKGRYR